MILRTIPTSSKLKQFSLCPASVMQGTQPTNGERSRSSVNSPAWIGQQLHKLYQFYSQQRSSGTGPKQAYSKTLEKSKQTSAMIHFVKSKGHILQSPFSSYSFNTVQTQVPFIWNSKTGLARIAKYEQIGQNDQLAGTADYIIHRTNGQILIGDWKTGQDDIDDPDCNQQLMSLSYMLYATGNQKPYRMAITNPITGSHRQSVRYNSAQFFVQKFMSVDRKSRNADAAQCRYCHLSKDCPNFLKMIQESVKNSPWTTMTTS